MIDFPISKKIYDYTIGKDLIPLEPHSIEYFAKGRPIKPYPMKYDSFTSYNEVKTLIINWIKNNNLNPQHLKAERIAHLPINLNNDDVYYSPVLSASITCHDFNDTSDIIRTGSMADFIIDYFDLLSHIVDEIKSEFNT